MKGEIVPVGLVVRDQIGAAAEEALGEERRPGVCRPDRADQRLAGSLAAVNRRDLEVALGRPVEVDRHRPEAERVRDRRRNRVGQARQVALLADESRDLEEAPELRE